MITGKKNLFIAALEVVAVGIFLKFGYHLGNKLIEAVEKPKTNSKKKNVPQEMDPAGGRKRVLEEMTGNEMSLL